MTAQSFSRFAYLEVPCCPACSYLKAEHPQLLEDVLSFPSFTKGLRTGRYFITGCVHCDTLRDQSFASLAEAHEQWSGIVREVLNGRAGSVSIKSK